MIVNNIKYINDPKPGGKYGSIKTAAGVTIMVPPDLLPGFRVGMSCEISTKQQTWGTGTQDERVVTIATSGPLQGNTGTVQGQGVQSGYMGAGQAPAVQRANAGFQPEVVQGGAGHAPAQSEDEKSRNIFVCGVVQQAMSSGKFAASEIAVLTAEANRSFDLIGKRPPARSTTYASNEPVGERLPPALGDPGPELQ